MFTIECEFAIYKGFKLLGPWRIEDIDKEDKDIEFLCLIPENLGYSKHESWLPEYMFEVIERKESVAGEIQYPDVWTQLP